MRSAVKNTLEKIYLDDFSRMLSRIPSILGRKVTRVDKKIIEQHLSQQKVRKLHLGCGNNIINDWLNSDLFPKSNHIAHIDVTKTYPFDNETFDYVFSEHMIVMIPYTQGQHMLNECFRVLKDGGKIRISTPHLPFLISLYQKEKSELQSKYIRWATDTFIDNAPYYEDTFVINHFMHNLDLNFIYDEKVLRYSLEKAGFNEITRCDLNKSSDKILRNLEFEKRMPEGLLQLETLTLEAVKNPE